MVDRKLVVEELRRFNRFYTRKLGLLNETLTRSPFTLTEARILFEIGRGRNVSKGVADDVVRLPQIGLSGAEIADHLRIDPAYLARLVKGFVAKGIVSSHRDLIDGRRRLLTLTDAGEIALGELQAAARRDMRTLLQALDDAQVRALADAQRRILELLGDKERQQAPVVLRPHRPGDIGWVIARQSALYSAEYGWSAEYEALACEICADFLRDFKPGKESCWIAEKDGRRVGAVFLVHRSEEEAQLRLLHVEPLARGAGVGKRLVFECVATAKSFGYRKLVLWTNDVLTAARRVYERTGFKMVSQEPHHSFGKDLHGQMWELDLSAAERSS